MVPSGGRLRDSALGRETSIRRHPDAKIALTLTPTLQPRRRSDRPGAVACVGFLLAARGFCQSSANTALVRMFAARHAISGHAEAAYPAYQAAIRPMIAYSTPSHGKQHVAIGQ